VRVANEDVIKATRSFKFSLPSLILTIALALPGCVEQEDTGSATQSMQAAGESAQSAAVSTGQVFVHAYNGAATAVTDSTTTARVKTALFNDKLTANGDIHVRTVAGVVILEGTAPSRNAVDRAQQLAQGTVGVQNVKNELALPPASETTK
jgi:hyperosmotically inducible periplasmic protein